MAKASAQHSRDARRRKPPQQLRVAMPAIGQIGVFSARAIRLVWTTSKPLTIWFALLTLIAGILPAAAAYLGQLIVDGVVARVEDGAQMALAPLLWLVAAEGLVIGAIGACQTGISVIQSLLRAQLGHRVNVLILEKALQLDLRDFEDSEFYDKLSRARREASHRPLSLINRTFSVGQNLVSLISFSVLLWAFSPLAVIVLFAGGLPAFMAEVKFSGEAFRLFYWRSPETRRQMYLETVLAREDYVKEVRLFDLGELLLERYRKIFRKLFAEDKRLALRRGFWTGALGLVGVAALYGSYVWVVLAAVGGAITVGAMTMYLMIFKQGQSAVSSSLTAISGMYEDNLYLSNLYEYLDRPVMEDRGAIIDAESTSAGIRFENVSFRYPGSDTDALEDISFALVPGQSLAIVGANGSGKTTLIKLLAKLYEPTEGTIYFRGRPLADWDRRSLQQRIAVIFQDFARYQFLLGENIGAGDSAAFDDSERWREAARLGMVEDFLDDMPGGFATQLGRWFENGRELSGGQWQKVALARAFMRKDADILVLDEPTAAMDAGAESRIYKYMQQAAADKIVILISHRFSTVRMADQILVMDAGRVIERGSHEELVAHGGRYAELFALQAKGYQ